MAINLFPHRAKNALIRWLAPAAATEVEQFMIRVVYVSSICLFLTLSGNWNLSTLLVFCSFFMGTVAHARHMMRQPESPVTRRYAGIFLDQTGALVTTALVGPSFAICYFMIGSISVGYGLRFGPRYAAVSATYSGLGLGLMVWGLPVFAAEAHWIVSTIACTSVMPLYASYLTVHLRQQQAAMQLEAERLQQATAHDAKTGLLNQNAFVEKLDQLLHERRGRRHALAVLFLDLDRFKRVNDTMGHAAGDELLCRVAQALRQAVREADLVARLGGDEFAVLLHEVLRPEEVPLVVANLQQRLRRAITVEEASLGVGMSIGAVVHEGGDDSMTAAKLMAKADTAMYEIKAVHHAEHTAPVAMEPAAPDTSPAAGPTLVHSRAA